MGGPDRPVDHHRAHRPTLPRFDHLDTDYLDRLAAAGVRPEDVDVVVNTHLHLDHVGWNTRAEGAAWVPTFPNATYLIPRADKEFYDPANAGRMPAGRDEAQRQRHAASPILYRDSVEPVLPQAVLREGHHRVDAAITLDPAPGHTPGSSLVRVESGSDRAVFVGDLVHSPVQVLDPVHNSCFCEDLDQAARTRRAVLERAADRRELVVPAHFAGPGVVEVRRDGSRFAITALSRVP
ncbi:MBL fold metallo-hydrolase [Actinokineospora bangkokensis]|uniref:MBL fold metallo-hydrolase n=1 Tax=Actinokineospora bangkokensis TaxID=1193682 RepID=UPI000B02A952|nr:MBL fold metallo-hydrolase [Actinokineospora bangkokensis]